MLDDLRRQADEQTSFTEPEEMPEAFDFDAAVKPRGYFLGMRPFQRFVIAVILLSLTCMVSVLFLLVTERIAPPL
jgi:hypothetical protein